MTNEPEFMPVKVPRYRARHQDGPAEETVARADECERRLADANEELTVAADALDAALARVDQLERELRDREGEATPAGNVGAEPEFMPVQPYWATKPARSAASSPPCDCAPAPRARNARRTLWNTAPVPGPLADRLRNVEARAAAGDRQFDTLAVRLVRSGLVKVAAAEPETAPIKPHWRK